MKKNKFDIHTTVPCVMNLTAHLAIPHLRYEQVKWGFVPLYYRQLVSVCWQTLETVPGHHKLHSSLEL